MIDDGSATPQGEKIVDEHDGWDESAYKFRLRCEGFFDLCGGLLKLHNICGPSANLSGDVDKARKLHEKICDDFLGGKDA